MKNMTIKPTPKRVFIFTKEEFHALDMHRFQQEVEEIRNLPRHQKRGLMGRYIWYPKVLSGRVSYAKILADTKMRNFITTVSAIFPEWQFYMHPKNTFAPVQLFAQLEEMLVVEGPNAMTSRMAAPRANILTLLMDALVAARATASACGASSEKFAQQVSDVFGIAGFELATHDDALVPDTRRPQRKILLSANDLGEPGIQKVRSTFAKVAVEKCRAVFGFEMMVDESEGLPVLYYDSLVRFFQRVFQEIPESIYYLRPCDEGLVGVINCALQLQSLSDQGDDLKWRLSVTPEQVFMLVMQHYKILRQLDQAHGFTKADTLDHLEKTFAGFQLKLCPPLKP
jgi:hypothetical protein